MLITPIRCRLDSRADARKYASGRSRVVTIKNDFIA